MPGVRYGIIAWCSGESKVIVDSYRCLHLGNPDEWTIFVMIQDRCLRHHRDLESGLIVDQDDFGGSDPRDLIE